MYLHNSPGLIRVKQKAKRNFVNHGRQGFFLNNINQSHHIDALRPKDPSVELN
jgi:hypothetical protein